MAPRVCLAPRGTITYPDGGGYLWIFLNWALGFRALGCDLVWLELVPGSGTDTELPRKVALLRERLAPYGLDDALALVPLPGEQLPPVEAIPGIEAAAESDLLVNFRYSLPAEIVGRFSRSALIDIDPGLLQIWIRERRVDVARHDALFTVGERVADGGGRAWHHVPPCVALDWWRPSGCTGGAAFTTVGHWFAGAWTGDDESAEDKRAGFRPFLDLPARTSQPLELALDLEPGDGEAGRLAAHGWRVRNAWRVAGTPWDYQRYVQGSRGEFSCAKPAYVRLGNAWLSDRTVCYLASGKPAVVQHTGESELVVGGEGIFRVRDASEAAASLELIARDYPRQARLARALAEERFDARRVAARVLEVALA